MTVGLPDFPVETYSAMLPTLFQPPLTNPAPGGLYANVSWTEVAADEASRHLTGVHIRGFNFTGAATCGGWGAPWCAVPDLNGDDRKDGERGADLDPFAPIVVWAFDCDLTAPSRAEVQQRATQTLRLRESVMVARQFADRLTLDATAVSGGTIPEVADLTAALAHIEGAFADANVLGYVHSSPELLPGLVSARLVSRSGPGGSGGWLTPAGHTLVVDGGYRAGLGQTLVATSAPLFGWRDAQPALRTAIDTVNKDAFIAIAERSVLVSYEAAIAAAAITPPSP